MRRGVPRHGLAGALLLAATAVGAADDGTVLPASSRTADGVTLAFPAVAYRPPDAAANDVAAHARVVSDALGLPVDPAAHLVANATNRMLFRHPRDPGRLVKIYKAGVSRPRVVARLLQRELALADLFRRIGVTFADVEAPAPLVERGIVVQRFVAGEGLDRLHPGGYQRGTDPEVDRLLATLAGRDAAVQEIVRRELSLTIMNDLDCSGRKRPIGFDLGRCYENVFVARETGRPVLVDW